MTTANKAQVEIDVRTGKSVPRVVSLRSAFRQLSRDVRSTTIVMSAATVGGAAMGLKLIQTAVEAGYASRAMWRLSEANYLLRRNVGALIIEALEPLYNGLARVLEMLNALPAPIKNVVVVGGVIVVIFLAITTALLGLIGIIPTVASGIGLLKTTLAVYTPSVIAATAGTKSFSISIGILNAALSPQIMMIGVLASMLTMLGAMYFMNVKGVEEGSFAHKAYTISIKVLVGLMTLLVIRNALAASSQQILTTWTAIHTKVTKMDLGVQMLNLKMRARQAIANIMYSGSVQTATASVSTNTLALKVNTLWSTICGTVTKILALAVALVPWDRAAIKMWAYNVAQKVLYAWDLLLWISSSVLYYALDRDGWTRWRIRMWAYHMAQRAINAWNWITAKSNIALAAATNTTIGAWVAARAAALSHVLATAVVNAWNYILATSFTVLRVTMIAGIYGFVATGVAYVAYAIASKVAAVANGILTGSFVVLWAVIWPIGLVVLAVAAAIGIAILVWRNWETIIDSITSTLSKLQDAVAKTVSAMLGLSAGSKESNEEAEESGLGWMKWLSALSGVFPGIAAGAGLIGLLSIALKKLGRESEESDRYTTKIFEGFSGWAILLGPILNPLMFLVAVLMKLGLVSEDTDNSVNGLSVSIGRFVTEIIASIPIVGPLIAALINLSGANDDTANSADNARNKWANFMDDIVTHLPVIGALIGLLKMLGLGSTTAGEEAEASRTGWGRLYSTIVAIDKVINPVRVAIIYIVAAFVWMGERAAKIFGPVIKGVFRSFLMILDAVISTAAKPFLMLASLVMFVAERWRADGYTIADVWTDIENTVKGAINRIIDAINHLIGRWNSLKFTVPSGVPGIGGSTFGVNQVAKIPRLKMSEYSSESLRANPPRGIFDIYEDLKSKIPNLTKMMGLDKALEEDEGDRLRSFSEIVNEYKRKIPSMSDALRRNIEGQRQRDDAGSRADGRSGGFFDPNLMGQMRSSGITSLEEALAAIKARQDESVGRRQFREYDLGMSPGEQRARGITTGGTAATPAVNLNINYNQNAPVYSTVDFEQEVTETMRRAIADGGFRGLL